MSWSKYEAPSSGASHSVFWMCWLSILLRRSSRASLALFWSVIWVFARPHSIAICSCSSSSGRRMARANAL